MRVLFVEDDPMNRRVVKDMLRVLGGVMEEAPEAETGLRMLEEQCFDIVLMDLRMPGMDGLTAIRQLRESQGKCSMLPVIVVTADTALDLRERCFDAGADEIIVKPIAMAKLVEAIGRMWARRGEDEVMLD